MSLVATVDFTFLFGTWGPRHQKSARAAVALQSGHTSRLREGKPVHALPISVATWECPRHSFLRRLPGKECAWKWPLALYWRLPKGVLGGRRTWAGPELCLPLLVITLLRGQPGHLEFGVRDHRSGVTGVLWPRLRWFVVGRGRGLGVTRLQTAALAGRFPAPWSVSRTPVPLAQWSSHRGSGEAAHRGWRPWGHGAHTARLLKPPCSYRCEDFMSGFLVEPARSVPTAQ